MFRVTRCPSCHGFFSTTAEKAVKCPRCGKSQEIKPVFTTGDGLEAANAVRKLMSEKSL